MRAHTLSVLFAAGFFATAAQAQQFEPGQDVIVNPQAAAGGQVLLYPGGQYMRVVPPLREPGAHYGPIHLHMPRHHAVHMVRKAKAAASETVAEAPPAAVAAPVAAPVIHRHVRHAAAPVSAAASSPAASSPPVDNGLAADLAITPPTPPRTAPRVASAEPDAPVAPTGARNRHVIIFAPAAPEPAPNALGAIKFLASDLNADLAGGNSRIQILAYGGARGDKGTEARRLSLKRALSIRQALIDDGVPAERIDVRAMGGADDGGPPDRVDVYVKS